MSEPHPATNTRASALVTTTILDCLLQTLMNKNLLLPSEVNDIFAAAGLLLAQAEANDPAATQLALADIADRLGERP